MYKICFYAPPSHAESIKQAMFAKGAGKIGHYTCCAWQVLGEGQFMPKGGSEPFIGTVNQMEKVSEYRIEMVCETHLLKDVIQALKQHHPYEEPAYAVFHMENV